MFTGLPLTQFVMLARLTVAVCTVDLSRKQTPESLIFARFLRCVVVIPAHFIDFLPEKSVTTETGRRSWGLWLSPPVDRRNILVVPCFHSFPGVILL